MVYSTYVFNLVSLTPEQDFLLSGLFIICIFVYLLYTHNSILNT